MMTPLPCKSGCGLAQLLGYCERGSGFQSAFFMSVCSFKSFHTQIHFPTWTARLVAHALACEGFWSFRGPKPSQAKACATVGIVVRFCGGRRLRSASRAAEVHGSPL